MKNILYVTHRVPWPPNRGDRIRTWNIVRYLGARCRLHVVCLADEPPVPDAQAALEEHCETVSIVPTGRSRWLHAAVSFLVGRTVTEGLFHSRRLRSVIKQRSRSVCFDATLASSSGVARYLHTEGLLGARRWVDLIDVDSQKWLDYAVDSNPVMAQVYRREGERLRQLEVRLAQRCERLTVVSDAEVDVFRSFSDAGEVSAITNGVDLDYFARPLDAVETPRCVFVGVLNYKPNADGVVWFANNVWPQVRERHPEARFEVVGRDPGPEVLALSEIDGVDVVGSVPDVRPYLWHASAVVTPLLIARGVQNKVLEAFAAGRPVVSSPPPLVGLDIRPDHHAIRAETPDEWVRALDELLHSPQRRASLGEAAREWVTEHHRWETCLAGFDGLIDAPTAAAIAMPADPVGEHA